ncbi:ABC transporter ATP-binding protein [Mucilaginibacter arboris]|uniref:ATP-binding cassette domain-containing protein n=1 Tax=Mucilaginibacter arboris TaxID=2682090 RepID=A0A7K1SY64_9SPHI|nr:ABC transporter ATP-binding protein [Mucilaginibacter arboris]MVN22243.1 ATP-binding cassette domain-containing protein [Mucilaginibacter arboris]
MSTAIKVENLSKAYQLGTIGTGTLSRDLERWFAKVRGKEDPFMTIGEANDRSVKGASDIVLSLNNISFDIQQGDAVGIIGRNGAGKSTLLKLLSRVTSPTTGSIKVKGRIASLLEVGTGFHPELTGRENIFLNGAILGMRKKEIKRKFDEIVDFAGVERYIDTPVKRYSSGMYVRLAFAVAAHLESEILIVDEVLAVGDAEFQKKCLGKMGEVSKGEGRTVLFVSHNISSVRNLCTTGLLLVNGSLKAASTVNNVINEYVSTKKSSLVWEGRNGDDAIVITKTFISTNNKTEAFFTSDEIIITINLEILQNLGEIGVGFNILSSEHSPLARIFFNDYNDLNTLAIGKYEIIFTIPSYSLASGSYEVVFDISLPGIKKVNSDKVNLGFELSSESLIGNRYYNENVPGFNSLFRPNWFTVANKLQ